MAFQFRDLVIQVRPDTGEDDEVQKSGCTPNSCTPTNYEVPSPDDDYDDDQDGDYVDYPQSGCTPNSCVTRKDDEPKDDKSLRTLAVLKGQLRQALERDARTV